MTDFETTTRALSKRDEARLIRKAMKGEITQLATYLVTDPIYLEDVQRAMREGRLHPAIQQMLWAYAFGKPKERIEVSEAKVVKIIHEFAEQPRTVEGEVIDAQ
jgi:hypothetical protein